MLLLLVTACGKMEPAVCVAPQASQDCDSGGVVLLENFDGGTGTMTTCHVCTPGTQCTFQSNGVFVDGVCE